MTNEVRQTKLPTKDQWCALELNRALLTPRSSVVKTLFALLFATLLTTYSPAALVVAWLFLIFGANFWTMHLIRAYATLLVAQPSAMTDQMTRIAQQYRASVYVQYVVWGLASFMSQVWLPDAPRILATTILLLMMFYIIITRNYVHRHLMQRALTIFIGLLFFSGLLRLALNPYQEQAILRLAAFTFFLGLNGCLMWVGGRRLNMDYLKRLDAEYVKLQLIESLEHAKEKLRLEHQALRDATAVILQFYSAAAHDLRQPVYAMQIYTDMLMQDTAQAAVLLPKIAQSCKAINVMFNGLFDFQKMNLLDKHLLEKQPEPTKVNIETVFQNMALYFEPLASVKNLDLRFKPLKGFVTIEPMYLMRILSNFITNAIRYTTTGGVLVGVRKTKTHVSFEVWDTGIGIDATVKDHIFTEFYKVDHSDITNENLGIGLAIVKQLTARIDGADVLFQSKLSRGSVFKLQLPIALYSAS
jgi:signal transduction histidine kinase